MRDLGCPRAPHGTRRAHNYQPFAADMTGESRTLAVIFCSQCGHILQVEPTPEVQPLDDQVQLAWPRGSELR